MNRILKSVTLICALLFVAGCTDDEYAGRSRRVYHSGDEVVFGAKASVPAGNEGAKNSRTSYGKVSEDGKSISLQWMEGDLIDIVCPQASGADSATYQIPASEDKKNIAESLLRVSEASGLQWNGEGEHVFYGIYPSHHVFGVNGNYPEEMLERPRFSVNMEKNKAEGFLPMNYTARDMLRTTDSKGVRHYNVSPNMDFAFMVAKKSTTLEQVNAEGSLTLKFEPLATVLEFDITGGIIGNVVEVDNQKSRVNATDEVKEIQLERIQLISEKHNLSGAFEYRFSGDTGTGTDGVLRNTSDPGSRNSMNLYLAYPNMPPEKKVMIKTDDVCTVSFFLMPDADLEARDLKIKIWYTVGPYERVRTATLGTDIHIKHKYAFKHFTMPEIKTNVNGSTWFSAIDDDALMNQVSILCAGNAFSNDENMPWHARQQVLDYKTLWARGVRGFEFVTQSCGETGQNPLEGLMNEHFVCGEIEMDGQADNGAGTKVESPTFGQAFASLAKFLILDKYKEYHSETLVLIARYHAVNDGYNPSRYVKNLSDFLSYAAQYGVEDDEGNHFTIPHEKYVLLTANSTARDLKGKIAIIVRPGDDDYCNYVHTLTTGSAREQLGEPWINKLCYVENWGSAYDRWDTRYDGVCREGTWGVSSGTGGGAGTSVRKVEDCLWGVSDYEPGNPRTEFKLPWDNKANNTVLNNLNFRPFNFENRFNFKSRVNGVEDGGYIQEWARVIPADFNESTLKISSMVNGRDNDETLQVDYSYKNGYENSYGTAELWYRWPSSYEEKCNAIKNVFELSVERVGNAHEPLCVNVLSGYFADESHSNSFEPFQETFEAYFPNDGYKYFRPKGQGNGGNFAALACNLNVAVYKYLTSGQLKQGPWGIVQVDYLGADAAAFTRNAGPGGTKSPNLHGGDAETAAEATENLMKLFIANNFSFPLAKRPSTENSDPNLEVGKTDEGIITE